MPGTPRQTFRISDSVWVLFQKKCAAKGYTASDVLRGFIMEIVKGTLSPDSVHPSRAKRGETLVNDDMILEWLKTNSHT